MNWIAMQSPAIFLASMIFGVDVNTILAMEVHERAKLLDDAALQFKELTAAVVAATDPAGPGGVTLTEEELAILVDEADDLPGAAMAIVDSFTGGDET